jgi:hypothetical protein
MKATNETPWRGLRRLWLGWLLIVGAICSPSFATAEAGKSSGGEEKFETLAAGSRVYSNVCVVSRSPKQITITHSGGMISLKLADLEPEVQARLGYDPAKDPANNGKNAKGLPFAKALSAQAEQARQIKAKLEEFLREHDQYRSQAVLGAAIGLPLLYLVYCFCFLHLCRKAGVNAPLKVWVPLLQFGPLFKAADMSRIALFWFMSPLLFALCAAGAGWGALLSGASPELLKAPKLIILVGGLQALLTFASLMVGVVWCFKICIARGKNSFLGVFLILPLTNLLMLCYLAFSGGSKPEKGGGKQRVKAGSALKFA